MERGTESDDEELRRLQKDLEQAGRVNTLMFAEGVKPDLAKMQLQDLGVKLVDLADNKVSIETESAVLSDGLESAAVQTAGPQNEIFLQAPQADEDCLQWPLCRLQ